MESPRNDHSQTIPLYEELHSLRVESSEWLNSANQLAVGSSPHMQFIAQIKEKFQQLSTHWEVFCLDCSAKTSELQNNQHKKQFPQQKSFHRQKELESQDFQFRTDSSRWLSTITYYQALWSKNLKRMRHFAHTQRRVPSELFLESIVKELDSDVPDLDFRKLRPQPTPPKHSSPLKCPLIEGNDAISHRSAFSGNSEHSGPFSKRVTHPLACVSSFSSEAASEVPDSKEIKKAIDLLRRANLLSAGSDLLAKLAGMIQEPDFEHFVLRESSKPLKKSCLAEVPPKGVLDVDLKQTILSPEDLLNSGNFRQKPTLEDLLNCSLDSEWRAEEPLRGDWGANHLYGVLTDSALDVRKTQMDYHSTGVASTNDASGLEFRMSLKTMGTKNSQKPGSRDVNIS